jgi:hypothetical protein
MKKGTRTWVLWYIVIMHLFAIIGSTGIVMWMSLYYPGLWNWLILIVMSLVNYILFDSTFKLIDRIVRRKNRNF